MEAAFANESPDVTELKRRIRRTLSLLRLLASRAGAQESSGDSALHLAGRIAAIGRAALAPLSAGDMDLEALVLDELLFYPACREQTSVSGTVVRLNALSAELMRLAMHEFATNAVKYGALSQPGAKVTILWWLAERAASRWLHFEWLETGVSLKSGAAPLRGFGSQLVERMIASELRGEGKMALLPEGMRYTIDIPLVLATTSI